MHGGLCPHGNYGVVSLLYWPPLGKIENLVSSEGTPFLKITVMNTIIHGVIYEFVALYEGYLLARVARFIGDYCILFEGI